MSNQASVLPLAEEAAPCCPPMTSAALSDPVRLRLFSRIAAHEGGEACVCDIQDVGVSQPPVSHHLKKLREAGLPASQRRGTWVYYKLDPAAVAALAALLAAR